MAMTASRAGLGPGWRVPVGAAVPGPVVRAVRTTTEPGAQMRSAMRAGQPPGVPPQDNAANAGTPIGAVEGLHPVRNALVQDNRHPASEEIGVAPADGFPIA